MFWFWLTVAFCIVAGIGRAVEIRRTEQATQETTRLLRELLDRR